MAFKLEKDDMMGTAPMEYYTGTAGQSYVPGMALRLENGTLTLAEPDAQGAQQLICAGSVPGAEVSARQVPCYRILPGRVYSAPLTVDGSNLKIGEKVTLSADGMGLTATTVNGVCEIVHMEGTEPGDRVHIRFS